MDLLFLAELLILRAIQLWIELPRNAWSMPDRPFDQLPLVNYTGGQIQDSNVILVRSITSLATIRGASGFGSFAVAAPGSYIEIYGPSLSGETSREWTTADFTGGAAPTSLDEISVTVGGKPAFVSYISAGQVNVQVPADAPIGENQPVVLSYQGRPIASGSLSIRAVAGGLLAPASFKVGDRQYVVAVHRDGTFVSNGSIEGVPSAPAIPGETLVLYGVGFGRSIRAAYRSRDRLSRVRQQ